MSILILLNTQAGFRHISRLSVTVLLLVAFVVIAQPAAAGGNTIPVQGTVHEVVYGGRNCPSPIQTCGKGPISGSKLNGLLTGILNAEQAIYQNGQLVEFKFTGTATIDTFCGTLSGSFDGDQQVANSSITAVLTITGGTLDCANIRGVLNLSTVANPHNEKLQEGTYTGYLTTN